MNKTKIVCTMGPSCNTLEIIKEMMKSGMRVARFNMSHGTHESHKAQMDLVKQARKELDLPVSIMVDTKGPEIRIKQFKNGKVNLQKGQVFLLTTEAVEGDESIVSVTYKKLPSILNPGVKILLNDGLIELTVDSVDGNIVKTVVSVGGELSNNKSINIPGVSLEMDYLSDVDKKDIAFGVEQGVDCYSISFVNTAQDVEDVRKYLNELGDTKSFIISKIESAQGVKNMDSIIEASDGVMVARGDMGVEIPFEKLPYIQKQIISKSNKLGKLTITATQMLESMVSNPRPTRAEISDVANAIYDGTSAIMLSGETSAGKYPVLTIKTMRKIAVETEKKLKDENASIGCFSAANDVTSGIGYAACSLASSLSVKAILVTTNLGNSANCICRFRPKTTVIALTPNERVYYKLGMFWGITPLLDKKCSTTDELLKSARDRAKECGYVSVGDVVIQTAGLIANGRGSNMLVVSEIN